MAPAARAEGAVRDILIASDSRGVQDEVRAVLSSRDYSVRTVTTGPEVIAAVGERTPDLLVCDFQIGNMGGMAVSLDLRLEESGGRLPHVPILLLLDREADKFLARRSTADAMLVKPIDAGTLRRTVKNLLAAEDARRAAAADPDLDAGDPEPTAGGPQERVG